MHGCTIGSDNGLLDHGIVLFGEVAKSSMVPPSTLVTLTTTARDESEDDDSDSTKKPPPIQGAVAKFKARPGTYLLIPCVAAVVGWFTNWLAVQMIFYPVYFRKAFPYSSRYSKSDGSTSSSLY
jgi:hypothetical protein